MHKDIDSAKPVTLKCRKCGTYPELLSCKDDSDPLGIFSRWRVACRRCSAVAEAFSPEGAIEEWNRVHGEKPERPDTDEIAAAAVHDIENILRAAEGRYTFICRFCAHWKTKDCCDKDGKCTPEWRGVVGKDS